MAEKTTKKVAVGIKRERLAEPTTVVTTGFKLRFDKVTGLVDIFLEAPGGQRGERVSLDPSILFTNLDTFKKYCAGLTVEQDDAAQKEDILVSERSHFSNIIHFSKMDTRSETVFGVFSLHDWVEASRAEGSAKAEISSFDAVVAYSTSALQKKLILEIIVLVGQLMKEQSK